MAFSTLVGGAGLGFAVAYVMLVVAAFSPGGEQIAAFMVATEGAAPGYGYLLIVVPYVLLLLHLWLRVNVARILLDMGEDDLAQRFASKRLKVGLLRGKREGLANRTALMRLACRRGEYASVDSLAAEATLPRRGMLSAARVEAAYQRWRLEALLRRENLVQAKSVVADAWPMAGRGGEIAEFCACAGELAVRNGDSEEYRLWRERSSFAEASVERMAVAEAFAAWRFEEAVDDDLLARLDPAALKWCDDVPGAALEVDTVRALLSGQPVSSSSRWGQSADPRSLHVWEKHRPPED